MNTKSLRDRYMDNADTEVDFNAYYGAIVELLDEEKIRLSLPGARTPQEWAGLLAEDEFLNNVPLRQWDGLHSYIFRLYSRADKRDRETIMGPSGWSVSDTVCTAKTAARRYASDEEALAVHRVLRRKTWTREFADGRKLVAEGTYRVNHPQLADGFSITGTVCNKWGGMESCGCIHDMILENFPDLAPLVKAHLCAPDGTPMHARANGWYFYSGMAATYSNDHNPEGLTNTERAARSLNIPAEELPEDMTTDEFERFCDDLASHWQDVADDARKIMEV